MCGLCGVLGIDEHWSDTLGRQGQSDDLRIRRRRDKTRRIALANRFLGYYSVKLSDVAGGGYKLSTRTGRMVLLPHLAGFCTHVETLSGRRVDPLDDGLITHMQRAG